MNRAFKIDPTTGDLAVEAGRFVLIGGQESIAQHVGQRLRMFLGEWPFDTSLGFPYRQSVFVKNPNLSSIKALVRKHILATPGVREVTSVELALDPLTRKATGTYSAITDDGLLEQQAFSTTT